MSCIKGKQGKSSVIPCNSVFKHITDMRTNKPVPECFICCYMAGASNYHSPVFLFSCDSIMMLSLTLVLNASTCVCLKKLACGNVHVGGADSGFLILVLRGCNRC